MQGRVGVHLQQPHLEVFINQEVTANEVKVAQLALQLGLDSQEAVGHDLLHPLLWVKQGGILAVTVKVVKTQSLGRPLVFLNLSLMYRLRCSMVHTVLSFSSVYRGLFFCMNIK